MPRKKMIIIRRAKKLPCRVLGCSSYGKPMLSQPLAQHLRVHHKMCTAQNARLPMCRSDVLKAYLRRHQPTSRRSSIGECGFCCKEEVVHMRLDKHVLSEHGLNMQQYSTRLEMKSQRVKHERSGDCAYKPYSISCRHVDADFCPAQQEVLLNLNSDDGVPVDLVGDPTITYPKKGLFKLEQQAETGLIVTRSNSFTIKDVTPMEATDILWHVKKVYVSREHEAAFDASIEPPVTTSTRAGGQYFKYTCQLCGLWHQLKTWATPKIKPKALFF